jgi:hypothetical protein
MGDQIRRSAFQSAPRESKALPAKIETIESHIRALPAKFKDLIKLLEALPRKIDHKVKEWRGLKGQDDARESEEKSTSCQRRRAVLK